MATVNERWVLEVENRLDNDDGLGEYLAIIEHAQQEERYFYGNTPAEAMKKAIAYLQGLADHMTDGGHFNDDGAFVPDYDEEAEKELGGELGVDYEQY